MWAVTWLEASHLHATNERERIFNADLRLKKRTPLQSNECGSLLLEAKSMRSSILIDKSNRQITWHYEPTRYISALTKKTERILLTRSTNHYSVIRSAILIRLSISKAVKTLFSAQRTSSKSNFESRLTVMHTCTYRLRLWYRRLRSNAM